MVDLTKWHNWLAVALISVIVGVVLHEAGHRFPAANSLAVKAYGG